MISSFPRFKKPTIQDKKAIQGFVKDFPPYSDFNFTSLIQWNTNMQTQVSWLNGNLVVLFSDYTSRAVFFSFIGKSKLVATTDTLLVHSQKKLAHSRLKLVPECVIAALQQDASHTDRYTIRADRNNADYILDIHRLTSLHGARSKAGSAIKKKRNGINSFKRLYGTRTVIQPLNMSKPTRTAHILRIFDEWQALRKRSATEVKHERIAHQRLLAHSNSLDVHFLGMFIDGALSGYTIYELLPRKTVMIHQEKVSIGAYGAMDYLTHMTAMHLEQLGYKTMNYQQDLGLQGLRNSKLGWGPETFLQKFTLSLAPEAPSSQKA